ncbi:MAG: prenyltransferase/squalene oxidase repeat-containing protein [Thermoguttaceae bacterium]
MADHLRQTPSWLVAVVILLVLALLSLPEGFADEPAGTTTGTELDGRGSGKAELVRKYGGSVGSEKAVAAALGWLANHQLPDGGWNFDHTLAPSCLGACRDKGSLAEARNGATAMALLPFLGAGQTHKDGKYKNTVNDGLQFLVRNMKLSPNGGSLNEDGGRMYSHGLASIALCEAYAMTHDKSLHQPAQATADFICYAQDPVGGGWRYMPRSPGDTSVGGWQIMALKSAHMADLHIPPIVIKKASLFLDAVQWESGVYYGYTSPGRGGATSAIGLLCRMYLGRKQDNEALQRGAQYVSSKGPSKTNMYYNYYATQVMYHMEGDMWKKWNDVMRDQLVNSQLQTGHEKGSWIMADFHGQKGGRLYRTSMATMILEVYYRHLPIYRKQGTEDDVPE